MSYYHLYDEVRKLPQLNQVKRKEIVDKLTGKDLAKDYSFPSLLDQAMPHLDKNEALSVFKNLMDNFNMRRTYYENSIFSTIMKVYALDKDYVKNTLISRNDDKYDKILPLLEGISVDDEARGLRIISQRKYCPPVLHQYKYTPRKEAIALLPSVSRLKVLETLSNNRHLSYNVFANFTDPDEFKNLMFSSVLRHRDRAEVVWNKYKEVAYLGQDAEVSIKTDCSNCGIFEIKVKSKRIRTKTGLENTNMWSVFRYNNCALCGAKTEAAEIKTDNNEE